jgi:phage replication-related protein YjqB (UPF0714/DUF867 family)
MLISDLHLLPGADDRSREVLIICEHFELKGFQMQIVSHSKEMFGMD